MIRDAKILVTGGAGFLGRAVCKRLRQEGALVVVPRRKACDLRDREQTRRYFLEHRPDVVVHAAWTGGGIGFAQRHPAQMALDNVLMASHVIDAAREVHARKFVGIGSICSYPKYAPVPFVETDLWNGYPEETNGPYGIAKRMMLVLTQAYRQEHGLQGIHLLMVNLYGPGDNFDPDDGHVIPGMIRRFAEAKRAGVPSVALWGDGSPTREFLYIDDAADAIVLATEDYNDASPVNIGTGDEISIHALATKIAELVGYTGTITWDRRRPNGQPRRRLDTSRARVTLGFGASTSLDAGLRRTIAWWLDKQESP